jgi:hypothetical protein
MASTLFTTSLQASTINSNTHWHLTQIRAFVLNIPQISIFINHLELAFFAYSRNFSQLHLLTLVR